ncbi:MAG: elongation factor Ts [Candidatus Staskawiczbacteria bacterium RIFCSPHIGHO2_02_FULL_33_16]|uniref:Elongation factor Ts n=1 Tax=Candidatus Staskawiczbacteria bacterium RIFCSPHIGHO2_02_FULL_33_16 TaxID=1802204 RepID=A0A1G2HV05_9BACT|nr:MAG: elongation factor Ts [Candidatus Staskawiczbacteria bacterium RIFCSPHIGHO2_02_FULL_33_16]OGZ71057.1 MAG: elongation factor Ts [Candidatus Staskawiczbacteria bacterium RIFCSPLOWO2_01_FULL_33_13]
MISIDQIKKLREETGVSPVEIKKALSEANGNIEKAKEILRIWGKKIATKKSERETSQGIIDFYIHPNLKTGVLLDIRCESDFVAKSADFKNLAHEICLQIAALRPLFVSSNEISEEFLDGEKKIYQEQLKDSGKPENIAQQIVEGKINKYKESVCLLSQAWIKDDSKTINNLIEDVVSKVGENIEVKKFARYEI